MARMKYFVAMLTTKDSVAYVGYGLSRDAAQSDALQRAKDEGGPTSIDEFAKVDVRRSISGSLPKALKGK